MNRNRVQDIIELLREIKEKIDKHEGPIPIQYLHVIKYKEFIDRNGLLDEFRGFWKKLEVFIWKHGDGSRASFPYINNHHQ